MKSYLANQYNVSDILFAIRFPERFYGLYKHYNGKDLIYKNPAIALKSFLISTNLISDDLVILDSIHKDNYLECYDFSINIDIILSVTKMLEIKSEDLISLIKKDIKLLNKHNNNLSLINSLIYDIEKYITNILSLNTVKQLSDNILDFNDEKVLEFRQLLFDLNDLLKNINNSIEEEKDDK